MTQFVLSILALERRCSERGLVGCVPPASILSLRKAASLRGLPLTKIKYNNQNKKKNLTQTYSSSCLHLDTQGRQQLLHLKSLRKQEGDGRGEEETTVTRLGHQQLYAEWRIFSPACGLKWNAKKMSDLFMLTLDTDYSCFTHVHSAMALSKQNAKK